MVLENSSNPNEGGLRPTYAEVNLSQLTENFHSVKEKVAPAIVMCIVKANAYGHGLVEVAKHLESIGAQYLGVAFVEEGITLRRAGIQAPILVLGAMLPHQITAYIRYDLTLAGVSVQILEAIDQAAQGLNKIAKVHLKIDTGMERIGARYYEAADLQIAALKCKNIQVEGIFSQFANADAHDLSSARLQLERFLEVLKFYEDRNLPAPLRHIANSSAILQLPESYLDIVRSGALLYGYYPASHLPGTIPVRPILDFKIASRIC